MEKFIEATPDAGKEFYRKFHQKGKVTMLNLLRFKQKADYSKLEDIKPGNDLSGEEAYGIYLQHILPLLEKAGSKVLFYGSSGNFLVGPEHEQWHSVLLVQHESVEKFMEFAGSKEYLRHAGHRTAALEDSRLLPASETKHLSTR